MDGAATDDGDIILPINFNASEVTHRPQWAKAPSEQDVIRNWPAYDAEEHRGGLATIQCAALTSGILHRCVALSEMPPDRGFREAALRMAIHFQMAPYNLGPTGEEALVSIPIIWQGIGDHGEQVVVQDDVIEKVTWSATPSVHDLAMAYPTRAAAAKTSGSARFRCRVGADSHLAKCIEGVDLPEGEGFGDAAQHLVSKFQIDPMIARDLIGRLVDVQILFNPDLLIQDRQGGGYADHWEVLAGPSSTAVAAVFPEKAKQAGLQEGAAVLDCLIADDGRLNACNVADEMPAELEFGEAGKLLAKQMRLSIWNGTPLAGKRVQFPIRFTLPQPQRPQ